MLCCRSRGVWQRVSQAGWRAAARKDGATSHADHELGNANKAVDAKARGDDTHVTSLSSRLEPLCIVSGQSCEGMRAHAGATYLMMAALLGRTGGGYYKLRGPVTAPWTRWGWGGGVQCCRSRAGARAGAKLAGRARQVGGGGRRLCTRSINTVSHRLSGSLRTGPSQHGRFRAQKSDFPTPSPSRPRAFAPTSSRRRGRGAAAVLAVSFSPACVCHALRRACCSRLDR
jgi:hypothetical protein